MKNYLAALVVVACLSGIAVWLIEEVGTEVGMAQVTPPDCTNGDCPPPPPDCTNGDCPPPPPDCTNGDCPPPEPTDDCCCVGDNQPGDIRFCCCRSDTQKVVSCRESLVLDTGYPDNWHQTLAEATLDGKRARSCESLMERYCDRPVAEVCAQMKGKGCPKMVKAICEMVDRVCIYRYCGPTWFPYDEPAPDSANCGWWNKIYPCRFK